MRMNHQRKKKKKASEKKEKKTAAPKKKKKSTEKKEKKEKKKGSSKGAGAGAGSGGGGKTYLENDGKFWEGWTEDSVYCVRFGKIGQKGQSKEKEFPDAAAADKELQKTIRAKSGRGGYSAP